MSWYAGLEAICRTDVPLRDYTWYRLGGPARWFVTPRDEAELAEVLRRLRAAGLPWHVLGRGANLIVRDDGPPGSVIHLTGPHWEAVHYDGPTVRAAAGADFPKLVKQTVERGLGGLEGLAGIPGTVGGALRMNAGGKYGSFSDHLRDARLMTPDGAVVARARQELGFGYRTSAVGDAIVLEATFDLVPGDATALRARYQAIWNEKYATQPPVSAHSAGCIFKNPPGAAAGALLDRCGLKGVRCGGAEISTRHANFILAHEGATARDVLDLIELARARVRAATGVELELEVQVW